MRVLLINDFRDGGGAEGVFRDTARILESKGHHVKCFFGAEQHQPPENIFKYLYNSSVKHDLSIVLNQFKPDVIHIHNYYHILSSAIFNSIKKYKKQHNCKVIFTAHDFHIICPSSNLLIYQNGVSANLGLPFSINNWLIKKIDKRGIQFSLLKKVAYFFEKLWVKPLDVVDAIITPSFFLKNALNVCGLNKSIVCVRNPYLGKTLSNYINRQIDKLSEIKFVFAGRLSREKGLYEFFNAAIENNVRIDIDVYGDGELLDSIKELVDTSSKISVTFKGYISNEELKALLPGYDVFLLPSIGYENAPLTIPEAASAGLVLLGTDRGGIKEMSEETKIPHFLYASDKEFLSTISALERFFQNKSRGFEIDLSKFTLDIYYTQLLNLYNG
ncbi:glycosyltransferase family 4 protein [Carboxylicivirga taeanensis]|uniref:glycosyltransferase family 4 protein n=1 Tax=Carboxylicivirga taeanensis TaxID=1416875 RepID=UPI003F6DD5C3